MNVDQCTDDRTQPIYFGDRCHVGDEELENVYRSDAAQGGGDMSSSDFRTSDMSSSDPPTTTADHSASEPPILGPLNIRVAVVPEKFLYVKSTACRRRTCTTCNPRLLGDVDASDDEYESECQDYEKEDDSNSSEDECVLESNIRVYFQYSPSNPQSLRPRSRERSPIRRSSWQKHLIKSDYRHNKRPVASKNKNTKKKK